MQSPHDDHRHKLETLYREVLGGGRLEQLGTVIAADYQPHLARFRAEPVLRPGIDALTERLKYCGLLVHRVARIVSDDDLAFVHVKYSGAAPVAGVDIFRFDDRGRICEHWNVRQPMPEGSSQGDDRIASLLTPDAPPAHHPRWLKQRVGRMLVELWSQGNPALVAEYYAPGYIQHNADMPGGFARIREIVETDIVKYMAATGGAFPVDVHAMAAEGDIVCVYLSIFMAGINRHDGARSTNVDIFRVDRDGKMIEHWDVLEMDSEPVTNARTLF